MKYEAQTNSGDQPEEGEEKKDVARTKLQKQLRQMAAPIRLQIIVSDMCIRHVNYEN